MHVGEMVRESAKRYGDRPAIVSEDRTLSFRDFDAVTDRLGNALLDAGLKPGDRVGVLLPNGIEGLVAYYALAKAGLVRVALNVRERDEDQAYKLGAVDCRALITEEGHDLDVEMTIGPDELERLMADGADEACVQPRGPTDVYRYAFTGGTTGKPKVVTLTMANEHAEVANFLIDLLPDIRPGDTMLHAAPVTHASGAFFLPHLLRGARNVVLPRFQAGDFLDALERTKATATFAVPTMLAMILEEPNVEDVETSSLRCLAYGASPAAPALLERTQAIFGRVLANTYGQAEAPMTITCLKPDEHDGRLGSAGRAYTLAQLRVVDEGDTEVGPDEPGEVVTRGPHVFAGYLNQPDETEETLRNGWLHTGDIGVLDEEGFLSLLDRKHDMIISGGYNVYPREVEDVLLGHPAVREAAVVGRPDDTWGETVHAVVATNTDIDGQDILDYAAERMTDYKRPRSIEIWSALPKSGAGKILRRNVRDRVGEAEADAVGKGA